MYDFPIGAIVDSFRCDTKEAVKKAAAIGIKGLLCDNRTKSERP